MDFINRAESFSQILSEVQFTKAGEKSTINDGFAECLSLLKVARRAHKTIFLIGSGGSAAIAGHIVTDFINVAKLKAMVLHDAPLITCMANDFGYDNAYARILDTLTTENDLLIGISSSGNSPVIHNAVEVVRKKKGKSITLTSFKPDNRLRSMGDLNIWIPADQFGFAEVGHLFILHHIVDLLAKK